MSYESWDQRFLQLKTEVESVRTDGGKRGLKLKQELQASKQKVFELQNQLDEYLAYIFGASSADRFLSEEDKTLLYWATEIAKKMSEYYQNYLQSIQISFWARMLHLVGMGLQNHRAVQMGDENQISLLREHRKRISAKEAELSRVDERLGKKSAELTGRYDLIITARTNYETARLLTAKNLAPKNRRFWADLSRSFTAEKTPEVQEEQQKLSSLSLRF